jgi:hypothetical protein
VPNVLGSMIVNNKVFSQSSLTTIDGYTLQTQTDNPSGGTNFNAGSGKYFISSSDFIDINSITFRISYNIDNTSTSRSTTVNVRLGTPVDTISTN